MTTMKYISYVPARPRKDGLAVVHNHVHPSGFSPTFEPGWDGFRVRLSDLGPDLVRCGCGWADGRGPLPHGRRRSPWEPWELMENDEVVAIATDQLRIWARSLRRRRRHSQPPHEAAAGERPEAVLPDNPTFEDLAELAQTLGGELGTTASNLRMIADLMESRAAGSGTHGPS